MIIVICLYSVHILGHFLFFIYRILYRVLTLGNRSHAYLRNTDMSTCGKRLMFHTIYYIY